MTKARKQYLIDQLVKAIEAHRQEPNVIADRAYVAKLARRFHVNRKTLSATLNMLAQMGEK